MKCILFYIKKNEPHIVLTQRATYNGTHSGQISFPGGKREITDRDIIHTALRETNEEIGVVEADVKVIGQLSQVYIPVSNFRVSPVVGIINYSPQFVLDNYEVDELIVLKLSDLMNIKTLTPASIILPNKTTLSVPSFNFNAKIVWGATALMLNELRWLLKEFKV